MPVVVAAAVVIVLLLCVLAAISQILYVCEPNEVLVLAGGRWNSESGGKSGYRVCFGGRVLRIPLIESVVRLDMRVMPIDIRVENAYSEGGIPLDIRAFANVKIASDPVIIRNAIERFLHTPHEIERVAKETLAGNLRNVLATMTPEEVNEDRLKFSERIQDEVHNDLAKLGLEVDTLKIQHVADRKNYMDSISRAVIAKAKQEAEVAESNAEQIAAAAEAEAEAKIRVAQQKADLAIKQKENELATLKSQLEGQVNAELERMEAAGRAARATAEKKLQETRTKLENLRLQAEVVIPAEANQEAERHRAAGQAAIISERGRATADAFSLLAEKWNESGDDARDVFLLQKLEGTLGQVSKAVSRVQARTVTLVDTGDGTALPSYVTAYPGIVSAIFRQLHETLGVDLTSPLRGAGGPREICPVVTDASTDLTAEGLFALVAREMAREGKIEEGRKGWLPSLAGSLSLPQDVQDKAIAAAEADATAGKLPPTGSLTPENVYAKAYYLAVKDQRLTSKEKTHLDKLAAALKIGDDTRAKVATAVHSHFGSRPPVEA